MTIPNCRAARPVVLILLACGIFAGGTAVICGAQSSEKQLAPAESSKPQSKPGEIAPSKESTTPRDDRARAPQGEGLRVVRDPETGKLRGPDRAEAAKFGGQAANRSIVGLRTVQRPNGVTVVDLEGRFQSYSVATRKQDGGVEIECRNNSPEHSHAEHSTSTAQPNSDEADTAHDSPVSSNGK